MQTLTTRRYDLDWLRVIAFLVLIFYHSGMFYVTWDWHVKSVHAGPEVEWLMNLSSPWRLSLLFFISGVALRFLADKGKAGSLMKERAFRLGLPILFGMAVIVMPQSWLQLVEAGEFEGGILEFWPRYLDPISEFSISTPTWNHLWYVVYLFVYTLMILPVSGVLSRLMEGKGGRISEWLFGGRFGPVNAVILPALPHILIRLTLDPYFPTTHNLTEDWANHAHSLTMLMTGFLIAKDPAFWSAIRRLMPFAVGLTILLATGLTFIWGNWESLTTGDTSWILWPARFARILYAWLMIASLLGLAQRFLTKDSAVLRYMTEAIFPWYILHQTIIVMAGFWLTRQGLSAGVEASLVILTTIARCGLIHEFIIRRVGVLRPLFGLRMRPKQTSAPDRALLPTS